MNFFLNKVDCQRYLIAERKIIQNVVNVLVENIKTN